MSGMEMKPNQSICRVVQSEPNEQVPAKAP